MKSAQLMSSLLLSSLPFACPHPQQNKKKEGGTPIDGVNKEIGRRCQCATLVREDHMPYALAGSYKQDLTFTPCCQALGSIIGWALCAIHSCGFVAIAILHLSFACLKPKHK